MQEDLAATSDSVHDRGDGRDSSRSSRTGSQRRTGPRPYSPEAATSCYIYLHNVANRFDEGGPVAQSLSAGMGRKVRFWGAYRLYIGNEAPSWEQQIVAPMPRGGRRRRERLGQGLEPGGLIDAIGQKDVTVTPLQTAASRHDRQRRQARDA